jgi:hypothetical protein
MHIFYYDQKYVCILKCDKYIYLSQFETDDGWIYEPVFLPSDLASCQPCNHMVVRFFPPVQCIVAKVYTISPPSVLSACYIGQYSGVRVLDIPCCHLLFTIYGVWHMYMYCAIHPTLGFSIPNYLFYYCFYYYDNHENYYYYYHYSYYY